MPDALERPIQGQLTFVENSQNRLKIGLDFLRLPNRVKVARSIAVPAKSCRGCCVLLHQSIPSRRFIHVDNTARRIIHDEGARKVGDENLPLVLWEGLSSLAG